jgi:hypothetical protein
VRELRIKLWRIHLGLHQTDHGYPLAATRPLRPRPAGEEDAFLRQIIDPVADLTFNDVWRRTAQWNSRVFSEVFGYALVENWASVKAGHRQIFRDVSPFYLFILFCFILFYFLYFFIDLV